MSTDIKTKTETETETETETKVAEAPTPDKPVVHPLVDVFEGEAGFLLVADLPGVTKDQLELTVDNGQLSIVGHAAKLDYRRSFDLGDDVDVEAIEAKLELGQLELHLPKRAEAKVRKIRVA